MGSELTVKELIALLQNQPQDLPVVVDSYEGGLDPVTDIAMVQIIDYPNRKEYYGIYDTPSNTANGNPAVKISSNRRGEEVSNGE